MVGMTEIDLSPAQLAGLREFAADTARAAAARIRAQRASLVAGDGLAAHTSTKSSAVDPVTEVDKATESFIAEEIASERPDDGVFGEEGAARQSHSGVTWIVDPIDGTVNFLYGLREYAVSIAASYRGELVAGAVINVAQDVLYSAASGQGATVTYPGLDPQALACSQAGDPALSLVATGFSYSTRRRKAQAELLTRLLPAVRDIRRMGSAALDLCRVAEGSVDAYYEHGINSWDFGAGAVIAREAGAHVFYSSLDNGSAEGEVFWAAAGPLAPAFEQLLSDSRALGALRG